MAFTDLVYTKDWSVMNAADQKYFSTHESNEAQVRADMQKLFNEIQTWINDAVDKLDDCSNIGIGERTIGTAANVKEALEYLKASIVAGTVPDNSLTIAKMSRKSVEGFAAVGTDNIANDAITNALMADDAIDSDEIADGAIEHSHLAEYEENEASLAPVGTKNIQTGAVTNSKIAAYTITHNKLATKSNPNGAAVNADNIVAETITVNELADDAVETDKIKDLNVTKEKLAGDIPLSKLASGYNVPIANGGTGQTTAEGARVALNAVKLTVKTDATFVWTNDSGITDFPYKGTYSNANITANTSADVIFGDADTENFSFSKRCDTDNGHLYIYCDVSPTLAATPVIRLWD